VDDELIYAFYDQQVPPECAAAHSFERWYREPRRSSPSCCKLTRDELMRHEAAGITTSAFPKTVRLGGVDCAASYLHEPGDAKRRHDRDGAALRAQPGERGALRMAGARHAQGQDPGAAQKPAPAPAQPLCAAARVGHAPGRAVHRARALWHGQPDDALLKQVRDETSLDVKRNDFKLDMLSPTCS
jgi:ATP-dependent helicase HrpA